MYFIKVHDSDDKSFFDYINVHNISSINVDEEGCTLIYVCGDDAYYVAETPEQIFQMIAEVTEMKKVYVHEGLLSNKKDLSVYMATKEK